MPRFQISPIEESDIPAYRSFLLHNHFSSGEDDAFSWYRSIGSTTMFLMKDSGKVVGSGISHAMGDTGWIGAICVDEGYRRQGLGKRLTDYAVETLKKGGCSTVLLRASETGALVYESLGFRRTGRYENFNSPPDGWALTTDVSADFRDITRLEERHASLDHEASGELRGNYLRHMGGTGGIESVVDGELMGFAIPGIDRGFLCSVSDEELIEPMMAEITRGRKFKIRTLIGSRANEYLHSQGYSSEDGAIRMALGVDPIRKIRNVAGTISSSIG